MNMIQREHGDVQQPAIGFIILGVDIKTSCLVDKR